MIAIRTEILDNVEVTSENNGNNATAINVDWLGWMCDKRVWMTILQFSLSLSDFSPAPFIATLAAYSDHARPTHAPTLANNPVELQPTLPICEPSYSKSAELFLFATVMEATMIDKKLNDKSIYFELSVGNAGNSIDGHNESQCTAISDDGELDVVDTTSFNSTTNACKPISNDKLHYYLPYWDYKPCMNVRCHFPDLRRRMYNSNMIAKFVDALVSCALLLRLWTGFFYGAALQAKSHAKRDKRRVDGWLASVLLHLNWIMMSCKVC